MALRFFYSNMPCVCRGVLLFSLLFLTACDFLNQEQDNTSEAKKSFIGTGSASGVYFPTGQAICLLANKYAKNRIDPCEAKSSAGSIFNINQVAEGTYAFGMAQSDWQYHAYNGTSKFKDKGAIKHLRAVFTNHGEPLTIVARRDKNIQNITDLKGKKVNIGPPNSGTRQTMEVVMEAFGIKHSDFLLYFETGTNLQADALCQGVVDAIVFVAGYSNSTISDIMSRCNGALVNVTGPEIDRLIALNPYYINARIPANTYSGQSRTARTVGVAATLVTSSYIDEDVVYDYVKSIFDHFDEYQRLHPAFAALIEEDMATEGMSAPIHKGAMRYYRERGWVN